MKIKEMTVQKDRTMAKHKIICSDDGKKRLTSSMLCDVLRLAIFRCVHIHELAVCVCDSDGIWGGCESNMGATCATDTPAPLRSVYHASCIISSLGVKMRSLLVYYEAA
jgi:hypothetical protein